MFDSERNASYYRNKALANGHIRKYTFTKRARVTHKETLFMLTRAGFEYLTVNETSVLCLFFEDGYRWNISVHSANTQSSDRRLKAAKDFAAMILADMAGSSVPSENFSVSLAPGDHDTDDSSEEKSAPAYSIEDFIRECLCDGAYEILDIFRTDNPDLVFHNQKVVKASVAGINDYVSIRDYQAGRYSGVIDSRYKTMALYTAPVFGMSWSRWSTEKEISAIHVWRKERSFLQPDAMPLFEYYAGLIVTGPRQFYNLYHDIDHVRRNKTEVFGGPFDHLYIFPFTKDGANQLNLIMGNLDKDLYQEATQWLLDNGDYHRNHDGNSRVFPLRDSDGHATALCFLLDAKHLMLIEEIANQFPQDTFTALCSSWQEPYCRAALPDNVQIISISG